MHSGRQAHATGAQCDAATALRTRSTLSPSATVLTVSLRCFCCLLLQRNQRRQHPRRSSQRARTPGHSVRRQGSQAPVSSMHTHTHCKSTALQSENACAHSSASPPVLLTALLCTASWRSLCTTTKAKTRLLSGSLISDSSSTSRTHSLSAMEVSRSGDSVQTQQN